MSIDTPKNPVTQLQEKPSLRIPATQAHQLIQLDPDILQWFQAQGGEYKSLTNSVLRRHIEQGETKSAS
jgi:uncharacterized protein (DUF4415 family)